MKLKLRGHHLLCLKGFQGYGYSNEFIENMTQVNFKRKMKCTKLTLSCEPDELCRYCPNLRKGLCKDEEHDKVIRKMDEEVLKKIDPEEEYNSVELFKKINDLFNTKESVSEICFNCMWHDKCLFYQKLPENR